MGCYNFVTICAPRDIVNTDLPFSAPFHIGDWIVDPRSGELSAGDKLIRLEDRPLRLLLCLAEHAGQVVSIDDLLQKVWRDVIVSPDSVYQAITSLRRQLGDDTKNPSYIVTIPRRGYRLVAAISAINKEKPVAAEKPAYPAARGLLLSTALLIVTLVIGTTALWDWHAHAAMQAINPDTVAVLPFADLTDQMSEEPFADGMAEELISQLGKVPGVIVSPPAVLADFKEKHLSNSELAKALRVAFMLEGSVRKSGNTLRVAARLTRASDGFIVWSESYDRSWDDKLMIQEDIAGEVSKALSKSMH